jgi:cytidine deaminase
MSEKDLVEAAFKVRGHAHAPYSTFLVGAALLTKSGKIFTGYNVENISFGLTICAERGAIFGLTICAERGAIAGEHKDFVAIAVVTDSEVPALPCGACRQVLAEFNPRIKILVSTIAGAIQKFNLSDLLPDPKQGIPEPPFHV